MHSRLKKTLKKIWIPHKIIIADLAVLLAFPVLAASSFQEYCNNPTEKQKKQCGLYFHSICLGVLMMIA